MTLILRALFLFKALVITAAAQALSVNLTAYPEYCGGGNGFVTSSVSGGVPPYSFLWSNAETTSSIYDVVAGTYSLTVTDFMGTQVTQQATVNALSSFPDTDLGGARAYCPPYSYTTFSEIGLVEINLGGVPIETPVSLNAITESLGPFGDRFVMEPGPPGGSAQFTYVDANGCPGNVTLTYGYPVQFPQMTVLNVEGACVSTATGSISVALAEEGSQQLLELELKRANGQLVGMVNVGPAATVKYFTGLLPGDYWLVQHIPDLGNGPNGSFFHDYCGDSLMVNVPDLGPACGNINGTVYMDYNEDCIMGNASETRVPGALLEFTPGPYYATANGSGAFSMNLPSGVYDMQQIAADIAQHCPAPPAPVNVSGVQTINIADTALVPLNAMAMIASGAARPGFELWYAIQQGNLTPASTGATSTVMSFDPAITFISALPTPSIIGGNTLTWNLAALGAFQQRLIQVRFQVPPDVGLIGNVLNASVDFTTANTDAEPANNNASTSVTITGSFDPNDKTALTSSQWSDELYYIDVDNWIDYTIRFQNTGTDTAFTVIITDTLPPTLDPATIQWGAASHACMRSLVGQGVVKHIFPNILLPDSNVNEVASQGFVSFRLRPVLPLTAGTVIENIANIYFDFNPPVITEPSVLVAEFSTALTGSKRDELRVYPNPASDVLRVECDAVGEGTITIHAADGRLLRTITVRGSFTSIDVSDLNDGMYVISMNTSSGAARSTFTKIH